MTWQSLTKDLTVIKLKDNLNYSLFITSDKFNNKTYVCSGWVKVKSILGLPSTLKRPEGKTLE